MATLIKRTYKAKLADGTVVTRRCRNWTIQYRDAAGRIRRADGSPDKAVAKQRMADLERRLLRGEAELVDPHRGHLARPILEHVAEYVGDLAASGRDDGYCYTADKRLRKLVEACGWRALRDVDANGFVAWRERARRPAAAGEARGRGRLAAAASATTLNQYLDTARAFLNWCASKGRVPGVPIGGRTVSTALAGVAKVTGPKLRRRRALTDEQASALLRVAGEGERGLVYRVGLSVGLRRQELADLVRGDLRLNAIGKRGPAPFIQLRAEATKARRGDRLDIPPSLADALRRHLPADGKDGDRVFSRVPPIEQWRKDLAAAGIPYKDEMGRQADFHGGTRKTLCNRLHRAGVPLDVTMRRMRHTEAKLTLVDYADDDQLGADVATLPELPAATAEPADTAAGA